MKIPSIRPSKLSVPLGVFKVPRTLMIPLTESKLLIPVITKLLTVFETYDNEADAVRSFSSSANV